MTLGASSTIAPRRDRPITAEPVPTPVPAIEDLEALRPRPRRSQEAVEGRFDASRLTRWVISLYTAQAASHSGVGQGGRQGEGASREGGRVVRALAGDR